MQITHKQAHILAHLDQIRAVRRPNGRRSLRFLLDADDVTLQVISLGAKRTIDGVAEGRLRRRELRA